MNLFLKILIGFGVLVVLAVVAVVLSPQGRSMIGMARTLYASASSPAAQELVRHGCATALVAPLGEVVGAMGALVDVSQDPDAARIVAENPTLVFCAGDAAKPAPDCGALARVYGSFDAQAPAKFAVLVQNGEAMACSGYFAPSGERLAELDVGDHPPETK